LRAAIKGARRIGRIGLLINDQTIPRTMSKMPHVDWKEWATRRPDWMVQDVTMAFEAFVEKKRLDALNVTAAEPASWKGDGERAVAGARAPDKAAGGGKGMLRVTGAVNVVEQRDPPRSPSPSWELSFGRKCRARNLIGCNGDHVMLQCEKLMSLGLAERKEVLEKIGLCMFCLKHAAELECYGRGGLSKPRCTQPGCDGEHTPGVHKLMGEESAGVNIIAEDGNEEEDGNEGEEEDEDEGWWVGTVGMIEMSDWAEKISCSMPDSGQEQDAGRGEAEDRGQVEYELESLLDDGSEGELAEDEWWDLGPAHPSLERGRAGALHLRAPQHSPGGAVGSPRPAGAKRRRPKKRPGSTTDQDWEEARRSAWLRQMLSDTSSDEDEERYGRFAESGRWMTELYGIPQHLVPTSGGECSG
jgi:hypothetical protein